MKTKLSFYEQVGIVIPGSILLFGLMFFVPDLRNVFAKDGFNVGGLGVFVLVAYAAGHGIAAIGNIVEKALWKGFGGMPSDWVVGKNAGKLLSSSQLTKLHAQVQSRLGLTIVPLAEMAKKEWFAITRQIYADVQKNGKPERVDTFNGNYGLNRGLAASLISLVAINVVVSRQEWGVSLGLAVGGGIYLYRAYRFGAHYARELFVQFLALPPEPGKPKKARPPTSPAKAQDAADELASLPPKRGRETP